MIRSSRSQLARAFVRLYDAHPRPKLIRALAQELVRSHRSIDVDGVAAEIARHFLAQRRTLLAQAVSARPLSAALREKMTAMLKAATGASDVSLAETINPALVGGLTVHAPGFDLDASVTGRLQRLQSL